MSHAPYAAPFESTSGDTPTCRLRPRARRSFLASDVILWSGEASISAIGRPAPEPNLGQESHSAGSRTDSMRAARSSLGRRGRLAAGAGLGDRARRRRRTNSESISGLPVLDALLAGFDRELAHHGRAV